MMVEDLSSLFNHVDIATSGSIVLTLRSHLVDTLSIPFVFVQCCKIQTSVVCKQKLHPNWWSSWGICETYEDMKKIAEDIHIHESHKDMVVGVFEVAKSILDLKTFGEWRSK